MRLFSLVALAALGCSAPKMPTADEALGAGNFGEPLVVDWSPEQRGALEVSMRSGVAVVGYDGRSIRLLRDCALDGSYAFYGMSYTDQVVHLRDAAEVKANLPLSGAGLAGTLHGDFESGRSLEIALAMVGFRRTTWVKAKKSQLKGQCDGATHFVKGAVVGAFAMDRGAKSQASTAVEVFGVGAGVGKSSERTELTHYGSLDRCKGARPTASDAPEECGGPLRLELTALDFDADQAPKNVALDVCGDGWVMVEGKCAKARGDEAHQCKPGDYVDCGAQCDRGHQGSCNSLAAILARGDVALHVKADPARAQELRDKACDAKIAEACTAYGKAIADDEKDQRAARYFERGCDLGSAEACGDLGLLAESGRGGAAKSEAKAAELYARGCDGGFPPACQYLAHASFGGRGVDKDEKRGAALLKKACDGFVMPACAEWGEALREGYGVEKDLAKAVEILKSSCNFITATSPDGKKKITIGDENACTSLGRMYALGEGVPRDGAAAEDALGRACGMKQGRACMILASMLEEGQILPKDAVRAGSLFAKGCEAGERQSCLIFASGERTGRFGAPDAGTAAKVYRSLCEDDKDGRACGELGSMLLEGNGVPKDEKRGAALIATSCDQGAPIACALEASLLLEGRGIAKNAPRAAALNRAACDKGVAMACVNLGYQLDVGAGVPVDPSAGARAAKKACDGGELVGCSNLAEHLEGGRGVKKDGAAAAALFAKGCESGISAACVGLGRMRAAGTGVEKDELRAVTLFEQACDKGNADGCDALGRMFAAGRAVAKDAKKAAGLFERACADGSTDACVDLAKALAKGAGTKRDPKRAYDVLDAACLKPSPDACAELGRFVANGTGIKRDVDRAAWLLLHACVDAEISDTCVQAASLLRASKAKDEAGASRALLSGCDHGVAEACAKAKRGVSF